jgi:hypothetical protein
VIIEGIVTTRNAASHVNVAPMGVEWGEDEIILKPFLETTTYRNLQATGVAVFNIVDDVLLFARAAISAPEFPWVAAARVAGAVLADACSWRELEAVSIDATPPRSRIITRVVHRGVRREFIGFNRARHAVLEAAILATRLHLIPAVEIDAELTRLEILVQKTAGPREHEAWALLRRYIAERRVQPA